MQPNKLNNLVCGAGYFTQGINLLLHPRLRIYILVPLLVNILLFFGLTALVIYYYHLLSGNLEWQAPEWLQWAQFLFSFFSALLGIILAVLFIIVYAYSFNVITNIIAAPFYGILAEKAEEIISGEKPPEEKLSQLILRTFGREFQKLIYFITRGIFVILVILMVSTIPLLNLLAPVIGLVWSMWCMSIQYVDYPADNHQLSFAEMRYRLMLKKYSAMGLGGMVMLASIVPVVNIVAMPAAVTAGTLFWVRELKYPRAQSQPCSTPPDTD